MDVFPVSGRWENGSFFHWNSDFCATGSTASPWDEGGLLFGSGRDALRCLLLQGRSRRGWKRLWMPSYFCQEVVKSLLTTGIEVMLYHDGPENPEPRLDGLPLKSGDVLLRMNYFGLRPAPSACPFDRNFVEIIDDHSHDPWSDWAWSGDADWCVVSLRKSLPIPDGGALWSPVGHEMPALPPVTDERRQASLMKLAAMVLKDLYLKGGPVEKETFRRIAVAGEERIADEEISGMPEWTAAMLDCFPFDSWRSRRRRNHQALSQALAGVPGLRVLQPQGAGICPFAGIVVFDSAEERDRVRGELIDHQVYGTLLWPHDDPALPGIPEEHISFSNRMFAILCDMRYSPDDMEHVAGLIRGISAERRYEGIGNISRHGQLEVLRTDDRGKWREVLEEIGVYAFYHLPEFHRLAEIRGEGEARMLLYKNRGHTVVFPMLVRNIGLPETAGLMDATSVSGFAGPLCSADDIPDEITSDFHSSLQEFFQSSGIVTVFSRLNPLIDQRPILEGCGEVVERGVTLAIDLTIPPEEQCSRYRPEFRREIRRLRDRGITTEQAGLECIDDFVRIYSDTMERVGAEDIYRHDRDYIEYLMREMSDVMQLLVCKVDGVVVSVALNGVCGGIIEGHLASTDARYRKAALSKLLYDDVRLWGTEAGASKYHLGGGVGASRDSLYEFKLGFGAQEHIYATWGLIVDSSVYDELCCEVSRAAEMEPDSSFFPLYRDKNLHIRTGG